MIRSQRLQRIVDIARTVERVAASALALSDRQIEECQRQLEQLRAYRREYDLRLQANGEPIGAQTLQEVHVFVLRLDEIIATVERKLGQHQSMRDRHHAAWLKQHRRKNALRDVQTRAVHVEQSRLEATIQREIDDRYGAAQHRS